MKQKFVPCTIQEFLDERIKFCDSIIESINNRGSVFKQDRNYESEILKTKVDLEYIIKIYAGIKNDPKSEYLIKIFQINFIPFLINCYDKITESAKTWEPAEVRDYSIELSKGFEKIFNETMEMGNYIFAALTQQKNNFIKEFSSKNTKSLD